MMVFKCPVWDLVSWMLGRLLDGLGRECKKGDGSVDAGLRDVMRLGTRVLGSKETKTLSSGWEALDWDWGGKSA